jgi:ribosomal-protein-serine acetyltransferase
MAQAACPEDAALKAVVTRRAADLARCGRNEAGDLLLHASPAAVLHRDHLPDFQVTSSGCWRTRSGMTDIRIETPRLIIRTPLIGDAPAINSAIHESAAHLRQWMPWAQSLPTIEQTTANLAEAIQRAEQDLDYRLLVCDRGGQLLGSSGLHAIDWQIPRAEIGYWIHQRHIGCGYAGEAVDAITRHAAGVMGMRRIELLISDSNRRSCRIPERLGFALEGVLREHRINPDGRRDHTRIYAHIASMPQAEDPWAGLHRRACTPPP